MKFALCSLVVFAVAISALAQNSSPDSSGQSSLGWTTKPYQPRPSDADSGNPEAEARAASAKAQTPLGWSEKPYQATTIYADQYWTDIENLCRKYSGATHPPCNRSNGAKMILDSIRHDCAGNKVCLKKAVDICLQYSGATHPACNASNGLKMTLEVIQSYENDQPKTQTPSSIPADTIDIRKGESKGVH